MNIQGQVERLSSKSGVSAAGKAWNSYSMLLNGVWYSSFQPIQAQEGQMVSFDAVQKGNFWNINGAVQATGGASPAPAPQAQQQAPAGPAPASPRDISILYQSSRKDAIPTLALLLEQGAIKLPADTKKADRYDAILALVDELTARFYLKAKAATDAGGPSEEDVIPEPGV